MKWVKRALPLLQALGKVRENERRIILANLDDEGCQYICDAIKHVITSKLLPRRKKNRLRELLRENKKHYRYLTKPKNSKRNKKKLLPRLGAGLGAILSIAIPLLLSLLR